MNDLSKMNIARKSGSEPFSLNNSTVPFNLLSFWQWSSSNLVGNTLRGILAEYIVAMAVGSSKGIRTEWDAYDLKTSEGITLEVKSGAFIQSWAQKKYSTIKFDIKQTLGWDSNTNTFSSERVRQSDVYVFCVLDHKDQVTINPLNLDQWVFYILPTKILNEAVGNQKSITMKSLLKLKPKEVKYKDIYETIKSVN